MTEFLTEDAGMAALEAAAGEVPDGTVIVELGVFQGGSLGHLARGAKVPVVGIDPWGMSGIYPTNSGRSKKYRIEDMYTTERHLASLGVTATLVRATSTDIAKIWSQPVGLLYIDAVHDYEHVHEDFAAWRPHLAPNAVVAFDDYDPVRFPGVVRAVDEIVSCGHLTDFRVAGTRMALTKNP